MLLDKITEFGWEIVGKTVLRHLNPEGLSEIRNRIKSITEGTKEEVFHILKYIQNYAQLQEIYGSADGIDAYIETLSKVADKGIAPFWEILETMAHQEDLAAKNPLTIESEDPLKPITRNRELLMAFIKVGSCHCKENPKSEITYENIRAKIGKRKKIKKPSSRVPVTNFKGASLPTTMPVIREFAKACEDHPDQVSIFQALLAAFNEGVKEFSGGKQKAYLTKGAQNGLSLFFDAFYRENEGAEFEIATSDQEYLPMFSNIPKDKIKTVQYDKADVEKFEEDLIERLRTSEAKRKIVFLSSVCRNGQRIATKELIQRIKKECPDAEVWIDAAQDNMFFTDADMVTYSKRMGGTGAGMILLSDKYQKQIYDDKLRLQAGYPIRALASLSTLIHAQKTRIGNKMQDLLEVEGLWRFEGKGNYMREMTASIKDKVEQTQFGEHFTTEYCDESKIDPEEFWKYGIIISFFKKENSPVKVEKVAANLKAKNFQIDWFSISALEGWDQIDPEKQSMPDSREERLEFFKKIQRFQDGHRDYLVGPIVLPNTDTTEESFKKQIEYLKARARAHEFIRIFIDASMAPEDINAFVEALTSSI